MTVDPAILMVIAAGYVLALVVTVAALGIATERAIAREGAETLRQLAVVRTRLGALVAVATDSGELPMTRSFETTDEMFIADLLVEVARAREKFPQPNPTVAALAEEAGEVARAMLHIREGKSADWWRVWDEAVQAAAMAMRAATEGDATLGAVPTAENCR